MNTLRQQISVRSRPSGILVILCLLSFFKLPAQDLELKFEHLTLENGLSHSKVNCIAQDSRGFLWFGTNEGLNRYDGYQFTVYNNNPDDPGSLSADLIRCVYEDKRGNIWIGTEKGGLNRFDRGTEKFSHFTRDSLSEIVLSGNNINSIIEDSRGKLWLGTERGIELLDFEHKKASPFLPYPKASASPSANEVNVIYEDSRKRFWVGTNGGGLCQFDREKKRFTRFRKRKGDPFGIGDNDVRSIYEDRQGNLWIGTYYGGLNLWDAKKNRFLQYYPDKNNAESTSIRSIQEDNQGRLWFGNRLGLYSFDRTRHTFYRYANDPDNLFSLSNNSVQCILKDAKGDLWIGTRDGINYLNMNNIPFLNFQAGTRNRKMLNNKVVYAILEDRNGDLWFGTEEGGLNFYNRNTGLFSYFMHEKNNPNSLSINNIKSILEDRAGTLWIGTFDGGLNCFDRKNNRFIQYRHDPNDPSSITHNNVMALLEDRSGNLWIGTYDNGLDLFDRKNQRFIHMLRNQRIESPNDAVQPLFEDHEGNIWAGLNRSQVAILEKVTKRVRIMRIHDRLNLSIRCILEDHEKNMWFGTIGGGLYCWNRRQNTMTSISKQDGLPSNVIHGMLEDNHGALWISTTNGLIRYYPNTQKWKTFYKENGLQSNQFSYNAYFKSRNGTMYFGGINGVTIFHPDSVRENTYIPPVVITNFTIFNKPVSIGGDKSVLKKSICETQEITLSYKQSVFTFGFSALNFVNSKQNQYAYMMEGFEKDWNYVNDRRFATYTNLKPGKYIFRVKAANNDGLWNEEGASIKLTILPPFWQKWWFKVILCLFSLWIINHFIMYQKQKRNVLETRALANVAQLKLLRNQMNPHFLFNAHNSIRSMILIDTSRAWQMVTELSEFLRYTLLNFNKIETTLEEEINAVNNYLHIEKIRYRDSLEVSFQIDDASCQCLVPAFFIQPLVENAIRYGMQTSTTPLKIAVAIQFRRKILSIDVSNTGKLVTPSSNRPESDAVHGTSVENMKKRLGILFKDRYKFRLFEENGWVHVKIQIRYDQTNGVIQNLLEEKISKQTRSAAT